MYPILLKPPVLSVLFWCLRVVGRRFCPLVEPKVWSLDWLLGAGQAGKIHPTDTSPNPPVTDMKDEILVWVMGSCFFWDILSIYIYIHIWLG